MSLKTFARGCCLFVPLVGALAAAGSPAAAQDPTPALIEQEKDWGAYEVDTAEGKVCYALSRPKSSSPNNVNRDPTFFFVTFRPKENIRNQVSVIIGYPFKAESEVNVEIGPARFALFTKDDKAFARSMDDQAKLIAAMKAGANMIVRGTSSRGTNTVDTYSLSGVTAALARVEKACP